jgi:tetratricopeptide (TPR) repeat protein
VQKGFPKDAEREFERAVDVDKRYYPAWYNLGLVRAARGDEGGARRAFARTVHYKPGHPMALFQLGLIEEKLRHTDRAIELQREGAAHQPRAHRAGREPARARLEAHPPRAHRDVRQAAREANDAVPGRERTGAAQSSGAEAAPPAQIVPPRPPGN